MRITTIIIVLSILFTNCKKGENDPTISLASRKSRISNEWNISIWHKLSIQTGVQQNGNSVNYTYENKLENQTYNYTVPPGGGGALEGVDNGTIEKSTFIINKDGSWEKELIYSYSSQNHSTHTTEKQSGMWNFLGKGRDYKNKEQIIFNQLYTYKKSIQTLNDGSSTTNERTQTYNNGDLSEVFEINQLKSKETILKRTVSSDVLTPAEHRVFNTTETYTLN